MTQSQAEVAGALVAIAMASVLVLLLPVPAVVGSAHCVLAPFLVFQLGCAAVLLSPAHRAFADLARRAAEAAREIHGALGRAAATEISAKPQTEATMRRTGAYVALVAASVLVLVLVPAVEEHEHGVLAVYAIFLLGCAAVLISPARRAVADFARRAQIRASANMALRWGGFACIVFCAAGDVWAAEKVSGLLLFPLLLAGVSTVSLSMLAAEDPTPLPLWLAPPAPAPAAAAAAGEVHDGWEVNRAVPLAARGVVAPKII